MRGCLGVGDSGLSSSKECPRRLRCLAPSDGVSSIMDGPDVFFNR